MVVMPLGIMLEFITIVMIMLVICHYSTGGATHRRTCEESTALQT